MTDTTSTDDIWNLAREAYLSGSTGSFVCREFDLPVSTFWRRAAQEGWLRRDLPSAPPEPLDPNTPAEPAVIARNKTWLRLTRALDQGRAAEAQRWLRLHDALDTVARREEAEARAEARRAADADDPCLDLLNQRMVALRNQLIDQLSAQADALEGSLD